MNNIRFNIYHLILFCCTLFCLLLLLYNSYSKHGIYGMGVYFGKVSMILLGLILFPITKLNVFGYLFGWSFDSTIYIHRLCGWFCIWFIVFHVLIITIQKQSIYIILILFRY